MFENIHTHTLYLTVLHGSTPVKNCWRMNNKAKDNKWYIIYAKSPQVKEEWMTAFQTERERVSEDTEKGECNITSFAGGHVGVA